eukprot:18364_1
MKHSAWISHSSRASFCTAKRLNNANAVKLLKSLSAAKRPNHKRKDEFENETYQKAMQIYQNIEGERHHYATNEMLNLCVRINKPEKVSIIWDDIEKALDNDVIAYPTLIKWCTKTNSFDKGKQIHARIPKLELTTNIFIQCALVHFYGHFGDIETAKQTFYDIPNRLKNSVSLNTMMTGYLRNHFNAKALSLYAKFGALHNDTSHLLALKACMNIGDQNKGKQIINQCITPPLDRHSNDLLNTLINFYGQYAQIDKAKHIFEHLSSNKKLDKVTINSMIKLFVNNHQNQNALHLYDKYNTRGIFIDDVSHNLALQACINMNDFNKGKQISDACSHPSNCIELQSKLMTFYSHFNHLERTINIFNNIPLPKRNVVTTNCMIQAYMDNNHNQKALSLFDDSYTLLQHNHISHVLALKACININDFKAGRDIHSKISSSTNPKLYGNTMLQTQLIDLYGHFGDVMTAKDIFEQMKHKDKISLSAMMKCMVNNNYNEQLLHLYDTYESLHMDTTHLLAIKACTKMENFEEGKRIIEHVSGDKEKLSACTSELKTSIIDFYGHFELMDDALSVFNAIPDHDKSLECINSMMNAYCNAQQNEQCVTLFQTIATNTNWTHLQPDMISYNTAIKGCLQGHLIVYGQQLYAQLKHNKDLNWMLSDKSVQTSLISMFAEFGMLAVCEDIFNDITNKPLETWNVVMHAFGKSGHMNKVNLLYEEMRKSGLKGDQTTFAILINGCSHCGDVSAAQSFWNNDIDDDTIKYDCFVVTALVDCFSRKGLFEEARNTINEYEDVHPTTDNKAMWMSLLSSCVQHGDTLMSKQVFTAFVQRFSSNESYMSAAKALLSNVCNSDNVHTLKCG